MTTHTPSLNEGKRRKAPPLWRCFRWIILLVVLLFLSTTCSRIASPALKRYSECIQPFSTSADELAALSLSGSLYVVRPPARDDSSERVLLRNNKIDGYVFDDKIFPSDPQLTGSVHFTGDVYQRRPSVLERVFGGSRVHIATLVVIREKRYLLHLDALKEVPFSICREARR